MNNVFVYGTLRTGQGNWKRLLENNPGAKKVCDDKIHGFIMYHLGGFPAIVPVDLVYEEQHAREIQNDCDITGEVFSVDAKTLAGLDGLEGYRENGNGLYNRMEIITENNHKALVYYMNQERKHHRGIITNGDWINQELELNKELRRYG